MNYRGLVVYAMTIVDAIEEIVGSMDDEQKWRVVERVLTFGAFALDEEFGTVEKREHGGKLEDAYHTVRAELLDGRIER